MWYVPLSPIVCEQRPSSLGPMSLRHMQACNWDQGLKMKWSVQSELGKGRAIPRHIKYASVSSVLRYHLFIFARPLRMASATSLNLPTMIMFSQLSCRNSRTGIVRQTVGELTVEKVWCAFAGSWRSIRGCNKTKEEDTHPKNFSH